MVEHAKTKTHENCDEWVCEIDRSEGPTAFSAVITKATGEVRQGAGTYGLPTGRRLATAISPQSGEVTVAGSLDPWCCGEAAGLQIATTCPVARHMVTMDLEM
ncbi:hypothetical protein DFH09DRAFT_1069673 [Mycena vulgaris]|nr:hypothetical protein DFH09DRAFT_1069673 [Mycena vulgaris]